MITDIAKITISNFLLGIGITVEEHTAALAYIESNEADFINANYAHFANPNECFPADEAVQNAFLPRVGAAIGAA
jgi:hypothetical protein